jgi:N-acetylglucosamine-6-sulfatase
VRTPKYLYASYGSGDEELYDLATDPNQLTSLHGDPAQAALVADLGLRLERLETCAGSTCRNGALPASR